MIVVEVNGVKYIKNEHKSRGGSRLFQMTMMAAAISGAGFGDKPSPIAGVDIVKEYGLIQQKKSRLSANQRARVVYEFERNFSKLKDTL